MEVQSDDLVRNFEQALEKMELIEADNEEALRKAKASYSEELVKLEADSQDVQEKQEAMWREKQPAWEDEKTKLELEANLATGEMLLLEKAIKHLKAKCDEKVSANGNLTQ